jgi:hypothetical protein
MILTGIYIFTNSINLFVNLIDISSMFSLESKKPSQSNRRISELRFITRVVITGDLNVDLLIETNHRLNESMYNFNLRNCINEPTRFGALLDPIIYSDECEISFSDVIQIDRNISDHDATSASLRIPYNLQAKYQREVWLYQHADFINLNSEVRLFDWEGFLLSSENIDEMSIKFTNKFIEFVKMYIPVKIITIRPNDKPWST